MPAGLEAAYVLPVSAAIPLARSGVVTLVVALCGAIIWPGIGHAAGCRPEPGTFNLKVAGTGCATGRSVARAYAGNDQSYECYDGSCTISARGERWKCRWRILRRSGYSQSGPQGDETVRGRLRCYRLRDQAIVRWEYSGAGA